MTGRYGQDPRHIVVRKLRGLVSSLVAHRMRQERERSTLTVLNFVRDARPVGDRVKVKRCRLDNKPILRVGGRKPPQNWTTIGTVADKVGATKLNRVVYMWVHAKLIEHLKHDSFRESRFPAGAADTLETVKVGRMIHAEVFPVGTEHIISGHGLQAPVRISPLCGHYRIETRSSAQRDPK